MQTQRGKVGLFQVERCCDDSHMGNSLRKVARELSFDRVIFFANQPQVVANGQNPLEMNTGIGVATDYSQGINEP